MSNLIFLSKNQIKPASETISEAFFHDPLMIYFFPKQKERKKKLKSMMELLLRIGIKYGVAHATSPNLEGISIWFPSNKAKITTMMGLLNGGLSYFLKLGSNAIKRQNRFYNYVSSKHKKLLPSKYWYLSIIGINPRDQGKGLSRVLLNSMFDQFDEQNLPCILDTNNEKNLPIYERLGFKIIEEYKVPDTDIVNWAMIRNKK
ncbi:MAG: GNAT family N-acetyltransferase [Candidatus Hodarchaeota archaeon]